MADTSTAQPSTSRIIIAFALIPFVASIWAVSRTSEEAPLNVTKDRASLLFVTQLYHHGDQPVGLDETLESEFRFRNEGDQPVSIGKIERSCGCMMPSLSTREVAPGEEGSIYVPINTINQTPGPHEYLLTVHYTDPKPQIATLSIKAVFPEKMVVVQPRVLYLSQRSELPTPFGVTISDYRDQKLVVRDVMTTSSIASADLADNSSPVIVQTGYESGQPSARFSIEGEVAGSIPPGRHHALTVATTDDPEFSVVTVPMVINGPLYPEGESPVVSPEMVQLSASSHPKAKRRSQIKVLMPSDWTISHTNAWPEQLSVSYDDSQTVTSDMKVVLVDVELTEIPEHRVTMGIVELIANEGRNLVTAQVRLNWP